MTLPPPPPTEESLKTLADAPSNPDTVHTFSSLGLKDRYTRILPSDIVQPTPIQALALPAILSLYRSQEQAEPSDVVMEARTGTGKTLAYLLPLLQLLDETVYNSTGTDLRAQVGTAVLIVVPTRELAIQTGIIIEQLCAKLTKPHWIVSTVLTGGHKQIAEPKSRSKDQRGDDAEVNQARKREKATLRKGATIVVGTPGRILDHMKQTSSWRGSFAWLVVDEADRLHDLGFEPSMKDIVAHIWGPEGKSQRGQLIMASATLSNAVLMTSPDSETPRFAGLALRTPLTLKAPFVKHQLVHKYLFTPTKQRLFLLRHLLATSSGKVVVFSSCCDVVDFLYAVFLHSPVALKAKRFLRLHGKMHQADRSTAMSSMRKTDASMVLFSTDIAARGVDWPDVQLIVHYDAPLDPQDYVHRAGRSARLDRPGTSILFLMPSEEAFVDRLKQSWKASTLEQHTLTLPNEGEKQHASLQGWVNNPKAAVQLRYKTGQVSISAMKIASIAYVGFMRAYATHKAANRDIFHVRSLHLGHLASSFGLAQPPSSLTITRPQDVMAEEVAGERSGRKRGFDKNREEAAAGPVKPRRE